MSPAVSPGLRDSITYFTDPALSGAYAHIPLLVTFCESMLDPSVKRCMFCGYSSRNRVHAEDLQARASELMADLREIFANASPREVSDWGPVSAGSSSALMEEDELRVVEEIEERNIGVAGLLLNTKELKLFCCDKCKNSADEADTKAVQRLRQSLLSQRENFLHSVRMRKSSCQLFDRCWRSSLRKSWPRSRRESSYPRQ